MKKIIVLGAGMVGSAIAIDLSKNYDVTSADINLQNLTKLKKQKIKTVLSNLSDKKILTNLIKDFDLVIGAVPGFMGFNTLKTVIEAKKNIVDISFFSEDPFELDNLAKEKNVTAVVDCGVAPGLSNMILGYHNNKMKIDFFKCCIGGLPFKRSMPFQYKAPFSPIDVIEEYIRPARIMENGFVIIKEALTGSELIEVENIGTLEAFNTDGLRTLLKTMKVPTMIEKTLRYPGHIDAIKILKQAGYFSHQAIDLNGTNIKPVDLSAKLLFPLWKLEENEHEFTYMQLYIKGKEKSVKKEFTYKMFDVFDDKTKTSSMARTTGYTCNAVADLILNGNYKRRGISPPEFVGEDEKCFKKILTYLEKRNIIVKEI
ncbi:MAG TPA: saccharopine dehydrogenase C-terminal domain-containing protein [Ignavibacteriaceae bacterium]|nr:saccharopine dehydrogenase C-terminal domain-containing protein [Ignavibacteriaceae bacterium]